MSRVTKTIRQQLGYRPEVAGWLEGTQILFNRVAAFYFEVIEAHSDVLELDTQMALTALERLTHRTKTNPTPVMPDISVADNLPALIRRSAIRATLGAARSYHANLDRWREEKERATGKGQKFKKSPPVPPGSWNVSVTFYNGMWKQRTASSIMLKLWTGTGWCWVKFRVTGRELPDSWKSLSPQMVRHGKRWWLHTHIEKNVSTPETIEEQMRSTHELRVCAVKLNASDSLAVCTIQTREGTALATRFIRGGSQLNGFRKSALGRIARRRNDTGIITQGEPDNIQLWDRIHNLDEQVAHTVSRRIVKFAREHGASLLVFEYLVPHHPQQGSFSHRGNEKYAYWLRSKIFRYSQYKAWTEGIITCRVSPRDTGRECAVCKAQVNRYREGQTLSDNTPEGPLVGCASCGMRGNANRNTSLNLGQKLFARYQKQEKPQTSQLAGGLLKEGGVPFPQAAKSGERPPTKPARHGEGNGHGTARG
ncbi:MAG: zinc ribbon domain-containing protein [Ktedonobacteraceae bacterium]